MASAPVLEATGLKKSWRRGAGRRVVLFEGLDLQVAAGECLGITGPSGAGKSSLLHILAGIDACDEGTISAQGVDVRALCGAQAARWRRRHVGFASQQGGLLGALSVSDNVSAAAWLDGRAPDAARVHALLQALALTHLAPSGVGALSGGETLRVALARALYARPPLVLLDEPTGALDAEACERVIALLEAESQAGCAIVVATHDEAVLRAMHCHRALGPHGLTEAA